MSPSTFHSPHKPDSCGNTEN
ncbi:hypothetical protein SBV1_220017 [Verrucomicrobia bacterium]|nr:hypothetical protein SBV1_220017 [Verrucomicrobiota bacterium]